MTNVPTGCNPVGPLEEDAIMANSIRQMKDTVPLIGIHMDFQTEQALAVNEISRAVKLHMEGPYHSCQRGYETNIQRQILRLETIHETKDGTKFRVLTEYLESFTIVALVNVETTDAEPTH